MWWGGRWGLGESWKKSTHKRLIIYFLETVNQIDTHYLSQPVVSLNLISSSDKAQLRESGWYHCVIHHKFITAMETEKIANIKETRNNMDTEHHGSTPPPALTDQIIINQAQC